jgi:hypothetical protein
MDAERLREVISSPSRYHRKPAIRAASQYLVRDASAGPIAADHYDRGDVVRQRFPRQTFFFSGRCCFPDLFDSNRREAFMYSR